MDLIESLADMGTSFIVEKMPEWKNQFLAYTAERVADSENIWDDKGQRILEAALRG